MILLSVIIPAYNAEKYITRCLDSVFQSKSLKLECVVINDGSVDKTEEILKKYSQKEKRLRFKSISNGGVSNARNVGINEAKGKKIIFLDADDYFLDKAIDTIMQLAEDESQLVIFNHIETYQRTEKKAIPENLIKDDKTTNFRFVINELCLKKLYMNSCCAKIYNRDIIISNKILFPVSLKFAEDACFVMEYVKVIQKLKYINEPVFAYRMHGNNTIEHFSLDRLDAYEIEMSKRLNLASFLKEEDLDKDILKKYFEMVLFFYVAYSKQKTLYALYKDVKMTKQKKFVVSLLDELCIRDINGLRKVLFFLLKYNPALFSIIIKFLSYIRTIKRSFK